MRVHFLPVAPDDVSGTGLAFPVYPLLPEFPSSCGIRSMVGNSFCVPVVCNLACVGISIILKSPHTQQAEAGAVILWVICHLQRKLTVTVCLRLRSLAEALAVPGSPKQPLTGPLPAADDDDASDGEVALVGGM